MRHVLSTIDSLLRGGDPTTGDLRRGRISTNARTLVLAGFLLGAVYGVFMGLYGALRPESPSVLQLLMTTVKVPLLFLLTLIVTLPSLYVFSALAGSTLRFAETLRLLLAGIVIDLAVLASFGPVTGFFTLSTESYPFMVVLNVAFFAVAGVVGLAVMYRALRSVFEGERKEDPPAAAGSPGPARPVPRRGSGAALAIFTVWTVIYGAVGAQMGWILRPFIGAPDLPVELFRERDSNFFEALLRTVRELLQ